MLHLITNLIRREIGRQMANMVHPSAALTTSYDPKTHSMKMTHQPDGNESGWVPIVRHAAGKNISFMHGPSKDDQAIVVYLDGDKESPLVIGFIHSDQDPPPAAESGETVLSHTDKKVSIKIDKDGQMTIIGNEKGVHVSTTGNGPINVQSENGAITVGTKNAPVNINSGSGKMSLNGIVHINPSA